MFIISSNKNHMGLRHKVCTMKSLILFPRSFDSHTTKDNKAIYQISNRVKISSHYRKSRENFIMKRNS